MWVKICANTNLEDAKLAAELGADALGFVFAPSSRQVTPAQVAAILAQLPNEIERIGVFAGHTHDEITEAVRLAGLTVVQMHNPLNLDLARQLNATFATSKARLQLIQTVHWMIDGSPEDAAEFERNLRAAAAEPTISRILVDSKRGTATGGTGLASPWKTIAAIAKNLEKPLILAGGLRTKNIGQAIAELAPWGVDVASGVEASPGTKDPARLRAFIEHARAPHKTHAEAATNAD